MLGLAEQADEAIPREASRILLSKWPFLVEAVPRSLLLHVTQSVHREPRAPGTRLRWLAQSVAVMSAANN